MTDETIYEDTNREFSNAIESIRRELSRELDWRYRTGRLVTRRMRELYAYLAANMDRFEGRPHKLLNQIYGALTSELVAVEAAHRDAVRTADTNPQFDLKHNTESLRRKLNRDCDYYKGQIRTALEAMADHTFKSAAAA